MGDLNNYSDQSWSAGHKSAWQESVKKIIQYVLILKLGLAIRHLTSDQQFRAAEGVPRKSAGSVMVFVGQINK